MIFITNKGIIFLSISISSLLSFILFLNYNILLIFSISTIAILYEYLDSLIINRREVINFIPNKINKSVIRGEKLSLNFKVIANRKFSIINKKGFNISLKKDNLIIEFTANKVGSFVFNDFEIIISTKMGFFKIQRKANIEIFLKVYPKIYAIAIEILGFLEGRGRGEGRGEGGEGEKIALLLSQGFEYAGSREYLPGDDLRRIDWKASARRLYLFVKQFSKETGGRVGLIYSNYNIGPNTNDDMVSDFLLFLLNSVNEDMPIDVTLIEDEQIIDLSFKKPSEVLAICLDKLIKYNNISYEEIYQVVDEIPYLKGKEIIKLDKLKEFLKLIDIRTIPKLSFGKILRRYSDVEFSNEDSAIIIFSSLVKDSKLIAYIASILKDSKLKLYVAYHSKPWIDSENLEDAYLVYKKVNNVVNYLNKLGCNLISIPILKSR